MDNRKNSFDPELLHIVWAASHDEPGWLSAIASRGAGSDMLDALAQYDDEQREHFKEMELVWREASRNVSVRSEMRAEIDSETVDGIVLSLSESISDGREQISEFYADYERSKTDGRDVVYRLISAALFNPERVEKQVKRLQGVLCQYQRERSGKENAGQLTDDQIVRARQAPISGLLEVNKYGYALCPFHEDEKPSFWTKGGFGYCFSCHESCDSIGFLMRVKGMEFKDAVLSLCRN